MDEPIVPLFKQFLDQPSNTQQLQLNIYNADGRVYDFIGPIMKTRYNIHVLQPTFWAY